MKECAGVNCKDYFYAVREELNGSAPLSPLARAAHFVYLNKTCFNGLYRVNKSGGFNVPWGKYENPTICDAENLRACSAACRASSCGAKTFATPWRVSRTQTASRTSTPRTCPSARPATSWATARRVSDPRPGGARSMLPKHWPQAEQVCPVERGLREDTFALPQVERKVGPGAEEREQQGRKTWPRRRAARHELLKRRSECRR